MLGVARGVRKGEARAGKGRGGCERQGVRRGDGR